MQTSHEISAWFEKAEEILRTNRITVDGHRYTAPSLDSQEFGRKDYVHQFMWDSCFHAIVWRWLDPLMAQDELLSLAARQVKEGPDAGMIPHCNYWRGGGSWLWKHDERSSITQPPLIGVAALLVYQKSNDRAFLEALYPKLIAYHDWFDRRRDPDRDKLVCLIHPWEAGGDALPRWDKSMGFEKFSHETGRSARLKLAEVIVEHDTDPVALASIGSFVIEPMDYNAIRAADLEAIAEIATILGKADEASALQQHASAIREAFQSKMVFDGLPYDLEGADEHPLMMASAGQFVTLFGGCPTPSQAERLVNQLRESRFWTEFPVTTSPTDADTFDPETYWRGNVWPCVNWLIFMGLRRYGYDDLANQLAERSFELLTQFGFWEYYHPLTGKGLGGSMFSWAAVLLDMIATARNLDAVSA
jgi:glycogen debranching enzyme